MKTYEILYVVSMDRDEEAITALVDKVSETITSLGGKVESIIQTEPWGRRRLAYPIQDLGEGYYVLAHFSIESEHLGELERVLKLSEGILRYMITRR